MSHRFRNNSKIKKFEDSFDNKNSQNAQDDTQQQPFQNLQKDTRPHTKKQSQPKSQSHKKEEHFQKKDETPKCVKKTEEDERENEYQAQKKGPKKIKQLDFNDDADQKQKAISKQKQLRKPSRDKSKRLQKEEKELQLEQKAKQLISIIDEAYESDVQLYQKNRIADKKLRCILDLLKQLKEIQLSRTGFICPMAVSQRKDPAGNFTDILDLEVSKENIQNSQQLEQAIRKHRKSRFESLRDLSERILRKWKVIKALEA